MSFLISSLSLFSHVQYVIMGTYFLLMCMSYYINVKICEIRRNISQIALEKENNGREPFPPKANLGSRVSVIVKFPICLLLHLYEPKSRVGLSLFQDSSLHIADTETKTHHFLNHRWCRMSVYKSGTHAWALTLWGAPLGLACTCRCHSPFSALPEPAQSLSSH